MLTSTHPRLLDDLEQNVDKTDTKLKASLKRIQRFVRETEGWCTYTNRNMILLTDV